MNGKIKYLVILILALLVSAATSYVTTLSLLSINTEGSQQQASQDTSKTKVTLVAQNITFRTGEDNSVVKIATDLSLDNLTIVYRYTCLNGTIFTESIDYGRYNPRWGQGALIDIGDVPGVYFVIPDYIIHASSSVKSTQGALTWIVPPQVEVVEIYGYWTAPATTDKSTTKIFPLYEVRLSPRDSDSVVEVTSGVAIKDLTIVYQYTSLNGTAYTEEVCYGDYNPTWSPNHVIEAGEIQFQFYRIPQSIISACSSTKAKYDSDGDLIGYEWDVYPKLTVTVYGYS